MAITTNQITGALYEDPFINTATMRGTNIMTTGVMTNSTAQAGFSSIAMRTPAEVILDRYQLNELTVQHRVQEFALMKLRESNVDYSTEIKRNLAKMASEEVTSKMTFTKKTEKDSDTHSFRGRIWVFSKEELIKMIEDIRNGIQ